MSEENKALFREFVDAMNSKDVSVIGGPIHPNFVEHNPAPGQAEGPQGVKDLMQSFFAAFPDLKITVNQLVAEADLVVGAVTTEGTQTGEFFGIPASGKKISISEMHMFRIADQKAVEHWGVGDSLAMMQQLGVVPED